ncbi:MAG: DNA-directed RNA polymerase subunit alpha [Metamycoplasmataceae bacterium]|uniref:DNA-directed RNA polymerase subunit alpha n=1 Tax=Mycoplasmopsis lipophila TaxID=2117 RepID=UPI0038736930
MEKMNKLLYYEEIEQLTEKNKPNISTFIIRPLERGFGNTLGVALRRVLLSNITSLALFAVAIEGVEHEFQVIPGVIEDVPTLIMNLRQIKFKYNPDELSDETIIKVELNANEEGEVTAKSLEVVNAPSSVEIVNQEFVIAKIAAKGSLHLEMFLKLGRGFISNEDNKKNLMHISAFASKVESKIKNPVFIATDSKFGPVQKVNYSVEELNSSSNKIEEELKLYVETDGTVETKKILQQAAEILVAHFKVIGNVDEMKAFNEVFSSGEEKKVSTEENDISIEQLGLSVRSLNALKRIGKTKISEIAAMTRDQLENTKNLGKKSIDEIEERLKDNDYSLSTIGEE